MYKKTLQVCILALLGMSGVLTANGGPWETSPVEATGNIRLINKEDITLDEELLAISLYGDYINVRVKYTLTNNGPAQEVSYAFPLDYWVGPASDWDSEKDKDSWLADCFPYLKMEDEKGQLPVELIT
ncbi:hypothetical protein GF338_07530, partial [candidate division WOR-3 bacterium]|nr:hypothetical protein [candidate division WOR-3 bacterium]